MVLVGEGIRIVARSLNVRLRGFKRYEGTAKQICKRIVQGCWNGQYFQTSASGHFAEFWTRDFGWCIDSLLKLGYRKEALKTLAYALNAFHKAGAVTTTINPQGMPFDFPCFAPDSLAFLMRALNAARARKLIGQHQEFLQEELEKYVRLVIDSATGLVRDAPFSSMKDGAFRKQSAYDTAMVGMLSRELDKAGIEHHLPDMRKALLDRYWAGSYFLDDLSGVHHVAGDAQVFPFWTGVIKDKGLMKKSLDAVHRAGLDVPFPLKYTAHGIRPDVWEQRLFTPNYEGNTIWAHMGLLYIQLLNKVDRRKAQAYIERYKDLVERYQTFLEVYEPDGTKPYSSLAYVADESMLWAANLLVML
jgi:hypothetical protein